MKVGDLVRFRGCNHDPDRKYMYECMGETGIITAWDADHPIVFFPSAFKTFFRLVLEVVNEA